MKTLTVNTESVNLLRTILENELMKLDFNLGSGYYETEEKQLVIEETDTILDMLKQLQ
jgi:hypothetical protein